MNETRTEPETSHVVAEDAPIGIQLWPTRTPESWQNFTLREVQIVRTETRRFVRWVYYSGATRDFELGAEVVVRYK